MIWVPFSQVDVPAPGGHWTVNVSPPEVTDPRFVFVVPLLVTVIGQSHQASQLTPAGKQAVIAEFDSYQTTAVLTTAHANAGALANSVGCRLTGSGFQMSVLPGDANTVATALVAILQTAANVT